jgi:hypothetical protein
MSLEARLQQRLGSDMAVDDFDARVARLQEHLLAPTADDYLARVERHLAEGGEFARSRARHSLHLAMLARERESQLRFLLDVNRSR